MHPYPHVYRTAARATDAGSVTLSSAGLAELASAPPKEFDGPGDLWSPETLLLAAVADCFVLSFRAVARASKLPYVDVSCEVEGLLERAGGVTRFTRYTTRARLTVPPGTDRTKATQLLERAEHVCLISASLNGEKLLESEITESA